MRVLLHIGRAKTGTSSLQYFLHNNPALLKSVGHHYPHTIPKDKINHNACFEELTAPKSAHYSDSIAGLMGRLHPEYVNIISAESLQNADPFQMATVFEHCDVQVVCYLRHEFDMLVSGYAQAVKANGTTQNIDSYIEARRGLFDYAAYLKSWRAAFGARLNVATYQTDTLHGGSIVSDFLHRFVSSLPPERLGARDQWRNQSLTRTTLPYVLHINQNPDQFPLPEDTTLRERVIGFGILSQRYPGRLQLPLRWCERLAPQCQASQKIWARQYLETLAPFDYASYPASKTDPSLEPDAIRVLHREFLEILQDQPKPQWTT